MRLRRLALGLALAATLGAGGCGAGSGTAQPDATKTFAAGSRPDAPAVTGQLLGGGTFDLASEHGHVVVLNFWASWCGPCRGEAADLESVYKATGATFIGVNNRDQADAANAFVRAHGITYPSLFDPAGRVMLAFRDVPPSDTPSTLVIDPAGKIAAVHLGPMTAAELTSVIKGRWSGMSFADVATNGPLILAIGASAAAGLVSFLSPCVLPLVPGYLSYMTGLAGADLDAATESGNPERARVVGRIIAGSLLFIAGFTAIFTLTSVVVAGIGRTLVVHARTVEVVVGILVIVLGATFLGLIPGLQREFRIRRLPSAGLLGAPVLGAVFALSWAPCISPTLGAVFALSLYSGQTGRGVTLAVAYCLGLGLPFLIFGLGFRKLIGVFRFIRRNSRWVTRFGGALLIIIGLALITGGWSEFLVWLQATIGPGEVGI